MPTFIQSFPLPQAPTSPPDDTDLKKPAPVGHELHPNVYFSSVMLTQKEKMEMMDFGSMGMFEIPTGERQDLISINLSTFSAIDPTTKSPYYNIDSSRRKPTIECYVIWDADISKKILNGLDITSDKF